MHVLQLDKTTKQWKMNCHFIHEKRKTINNGPRIQLKERIWYCTLYKNCNRIHVCFPYPYVTIGWWQRCCSLPSIPFIRVCIQGCEHKEKKEESNPEPSAALPRTDEDWRHENTFAAFADSSTSFRWPIVTVSCASSLYVLRHEKPSFSLCLSLCCR